MKQAFKYRLYPNKAQVQQLEWTLSRCRELYNASLQERKEAWEVCKRHPNYYDAEWRKEHAREYSVGRFEQDLMLTQIKHEDRPEYLDIGAHVLQNVLKRVDLAFQAFFRRVKSGQTPGYPRFQGKSRYDSFTFPDLAGWKLEEKHLHLSKIGTIKVKYHREIQGTVKTCTIKREGTHWYVVFTCEVEACPRLPYTDDAIGIDLGLLHFATLSNGETIENPRYYRKAEQRLQKAQQSLSRKKRGSKRRRKAVARVAKHHRKVRNQRNDFLHKQARWLVDTYEVIVFEDISASNMSRRPKPKQDENGKYLPNGASAKAGLNKSINDAGWSQFIMMCEYKAEWADAVQVVRVNPKYTSQMCSGCGAIVRKELDERWHECSCGCSLDRDHNAAINILRLGQKQVQHVSQNVPGS